MRHYKRPEISNSVLIFVTAIAHVLALKARSRKLCAGADCVKHAISALPRPGYSTFSPPQLSISIASLTGLQSTNLLRLALPPWRSLPPLLPDSFPIIRQQYQTLGHTPMGGADL